MEEKNVYVAAFNDELEAFVTLEDWTADAIAQLEAAGVRGQVEISVDVAPKKFKAMPKPCTLTIHCAVGQMTGTSKEI